MKPFRSTIAEAGNFAPMNVLKISYQKTNLINDCFAQIFENQFAKWQKSEQFFTKSSF